jgi:hypothetical protein
MAKTEILTVRIVGADKRRIEVAARRCGMALGAFVLEAAMARVGRQARGFGDLPSGVSQSFRAACALATPDAAGYQIAGRILVQRARRIAPKGAFRALEEVVLQSVTPDPKAVLDWCSENFPSWLAMVPVRRRTQFAQGVIHACDEIQEEIWEHGREETEEERPAVDSAERILCWVVAAADRTRR